MKGKNYEKKSIRLYIFLILMVILTGCQSPGPEQDLGDEFIFEEDNQYSFYLSGILGNPIVESETSYYASVDGYVQTRDKQTGACTPLCNKPDCTHDENSMNSDGSSNCNAYFGAIQQISYYKGKLYVLSVNTVYEIDASGSTRKELLQTKENIKSSMVHRGYLYLSFSDYLLAPEEYTEEKYTEEELKDLSYQIKRYRLDQWDGKPEVIYEKKREWGQINTMFAYGNKAYFLISRASGDLIYDVVDHSLENLPQTSGYPCIFNGKLLYFKMPDEINDDTELDQILEIQKKNMAILAERDGAFIKETEISQEYGRIFGNDEFVAADNQPTVSAEDDRSVRFYDKNMELVREIKLENGTMPSLGMNEDYFFYMKRAEGDQGYEVWALDLHKLDDPDLKGEPFFVSEK